MKPEVIYIGGTGRSGSTLLASLLGRVTGHVAVGELRYIWRRGVIENQLCQCRLPFRECAFWAEVMGLAFGGLDGARPQDMLDLASRVDRIRYVPWLATSALRSARFRSDLEAWGRILNRLYSAILSVFGGSVVVDSSKDPSYAFVLCAEPSLEVSLVHLVRDSRAVAYSWTRLKVRPEIHWKVEHMQRRHPPLTARRWNQYNLMFEALSRRVSRSVRIRYEDLVADPDAALSAVAGLTRLSWTTRSVAGGIGSRGAAGTVAMDDTIGHSMSGNPMRFEGLPVIRPDHEWIERMTAADRRLVTAITAPLLLRYGYLGSRSSTPFSRSQSRAVASAGTRASRS